MCLKTCKIFTVLNHLFFVAKIDNQSMNEFKKGLRYSISKAIFLTITFSSKKSINDTF